MLDSKDKKILNIMANNSRISKKLLAKKIGISREVINYRLTKLEQSKIVVNYQTRLNIYAFAIMGYNLFIKLNRYDKIEEKKLITFLKQQNYTHFIAKITGNYDYMIGFSIKKLEDLQNYLNNLYENFNEIIAYHDVFTMLEELKDNEATIFNIKNKENHISMKTINNKPKIDKIDKQIIKEIANNSRATCTQIANKLNMTSVAIMYRIRKLEKENIILGYRTIIDVLKLEKQFYYISFNLKNLNKENKEKIKQEITTNPNIVFANHLSGKYSYVCWLFAKDNKEFYEIIKNLQNKMPQITNLNTYTVLEFIYHTNIPSNFLDE